MRDGKTIADVVLVGRASRSSLRARGSHNAVFGASWTSRVGV
ncbi:MAG: hypothetical protein O7A71_02200 [Chloroflexi bacterium]|nr:hypothetical protein [Chloroflexota bacterium]